MAVVTVGCGLLFSQAREMVPRVRFGVNRVVVFISGAVMIVTLAGGTLEPKTRDVAPEDMSR